MFRLTGYNRSPSDRALVTILLVEAMLSSWSCPGDRLPTGALSSAIPPPEVTLMEYDGYRSSPTRRAFNATRPIREP
jgi:hypothetical protein